MESYASAELAFKSLNARPRISKMAVKKACRKVKLGADVRSAHDKIFYGIKNDEQLFTKCPRAVQVDGTDRICIFSDEYDVNSNAIRRFVAKCAALGVFVDTFVKEYSGVTFNKGYEPPKGCIISTGYSQLYRGKLVGIII
tara:strand:+ start:2957 stop:3379 length:423 start_codon:yes stop_codon:yes gene_type:complete